MDTQLILKLIVGGLVWTLVGAVFYFFYVYDEFDNVTFAGVDYIFIDIWTSSKLTVVGKLFFTIVAILLYLPFIILMFSTVILFNLCKLIVLKLFFKSDKGDD